MDLEKDQRSGGDAQFILNHDIFKDAWKAVEDALKAQRLKIGFKDTEMHTRLVIAEQILDMVKKHIENVVATGKLSELQLRQKPKFAVWK
jgi:ABC-type uncharacterized transport system substrate-binding protein